MYGTYAINRPKINLGSERKIAFFELLRKTFKNAFIFFNLFQTEKKKIHQGETKKRRLQNIENITCLKKKKNDYSDGYFFKGQKLPLTKSVSKQESWESKASGSTHNNGDSAAN